ncbi:uncharacterized protein LOC106086894 [Stomoxys calcitrans]|uniref:uncharacterized protein LOC106086894 n=1 Tax=Stomoxys calcitrans TaxID=35570 RepID=UPI0027E343C4|nr:uncharacterized protein LOC106086894 [Stomoxys calcitrans]XP_013107172.2 uncharacterized protein LOC106086894 [Stomoxys calcitrans]
MDASSKHLKELLKFAIRHQTDDKYVADGTPPQLDEERKQFLESVLKSMAVDVTGELIKALHILDDPATTTEDKIEALDVIRDYIDNIDFANNFVKIGGTRVLIDCLKDDNDMLKINAINVLAELSQNNPFCQQHFLDVNVMELLVAYLKDSNDQVVASTLYALSSIMQNYEPATSEFAKGEGMPNVLHCLGNKCSRVFVKACFLISSISSQFPLIRDQFVCCNAFQNLSKNLESMGDFDVKSEALLLAMSTLTESQFFKCNANDKKEILDTLNSSLKNFKGLPQCEEMEMYTQKIIDKLQ